MSSMKTTAYDRVSAMLITLLILIGVAVAILLALWLSSLALRRPLAVPVTLVVPSGDGAGSADAEEDPNVTVPGSELEQDEPTIIDAMNSVVDIVSKNSAVFASASMSDDFLMVPGGTRGDGRTKGDGSGRAGRGRHWEVLFEKGMTAESYAKLLDSFGIELGVLQPDGQIIYAANLSAEKPTVRSGKAADEKRYYLSVLKGDTLKADTELLTKSGVAPNGRIVLKFLPPPLEAELAALEKNYAQGREKYIRATYFRLVHKNAKYSFVVANQSYRASVAF